MYGERVSSVSSKSCSLTPPTGLDVAVAPASLQSVYADMVKARQPTSTATFVIYPSISTTLSFDPQTLGRGVPRNVEVP